MDAPRDIEQPVTPRYSPRYGDRRAALVRYHAMHRADARRPLPSLAWYALSVRFIHASYLAGRDREVMLALSRDALTMSRDAYYRRAEVAA